MKIGQPEISLSWDVCALSGDASQFDMIHSSASSQCAEKNLSKNKIISRCKIVRSHIFLINKKESMEFYRLQWIS